MCHQHPFPSPKPHKSLLRISMERLCNYRCIDIWYICLPTFTCTHQYTAAYVYQYTHSCDYMCTGIHTIYMYALERCIYTERERERNLWNSTCIFQCMHIFEDWREIYKGTLGCSFLLLHLIRCVGVASHIFPRCCTTGMRTWQLLFSLVLSMCTFWSLRCLEPCHLPVAVYIMNTIMYTQM